MLFALLLFQETGKEGINMRCIGGKIDKTGQVTKWGLSGKYVKDNFQILSLADKDRWWFLSFWHINRSLS